MGAREKSCPGAPLTLKTARVFRPGRRHYTLSDWPDRQCLQTNGSKFIGEHFHATSARTLATQFHLALSSQNFVYDYSCEYLKSFVWFFFFVFFFQIVEIVFSFYRVLFIFRRIIHNSFPPQKVNAE